MAPPDETAPDADRSQQRQLASASLHAAWRRQTGSSPVQRQASSGASTAESITVAYVDGSQDATHVISALTESDDLTVRRLTPRESLDHDTIQQADCLVSEYELPDTGQTGLDVVRRVRAVDPQLPVLLFTGTTASIADEAAAAGVTAYLRKDGPDQATRLANHIQTVVSTSRSTARRDHDEVHAPRSTAVEADAHDRRQHDQTLATLRTAVRELMDAEDKSTMSEIAVDAAKEVLEFPIIGVHLYDASIAGLRPVAATAETHELFDELPTFTETGPDSLAWRAFAEGDPVYEPDVTTRTDTYNEATPIRSELVLPLGEHGVMIIDLLERDAFDTADFEFAQVLAADLQIALDRAERTHALREQEQELTHLSRLQTVLREIERAITEAATREGVEQAVCNRLTDIDPYAFAWISEPVVVTEAITPRTWAHTGDTEPNSYLAAVDIQAAEAVTAHPASKALQAGEVHAIQCVADDIPDHRSDPEWCQELLARGYRATCGIPLTYGSTTHGVLTIDATRPQVFDAQERAILAELGETIGYVLTAIDRTQALFADTLTELEFHIETPHAASPPETHPFFSQLAERAACRVTLERTTSRSDGSFSAMYSIVGASPETVAACIEDAPVVTTGRVVTVDDERQQQLVELSLTETWFGSLFIDRGAIIQTALADGGTKTDQQGRLIVELPPDGDIRTLVETVQEAYPSMGLAAKRGHDRSTQPIIELQAALDDRLTDRQQDVLETAYQAGYFEMPRETTGEELADVLGIAQSTLNEHLRVAERKALGSVFDPPWTEQ